MKYPRTPYWPWSPAIAKGDKTHPEPEWFVGARVVVTEKLDGANTLIHRGEVYARSRSAPCREPWMGMVRKHHAWKIRDRETYVFGEDVYGVHSIEYDPVPEDSTFYAFALCLAEGQFAEFDVLREFVGSHGIPLVPVLWQGTFRSLRELKELVEEEQRKPSMLGGEREGVVIRQACEHAIEELGEFTCKSVRAGHVQSEEHWSKDWRPCKLKK